MALRTRQEDVEYVEPPNRSVRDDSGVATAMQRLITLLDARPGFGHATNRSVTTSTNGTGCTVEEGPWLQTTDLGPALGGAGTGPSPGVLARAALGSCLATGYRLRAAAYGVELTSVRVTVETDSELAGLLLLDSSAPAGFTDVRYVVEIESSASEAEVRRVLDDGDRLSPLLDVFARANAVRRTVVIERPGG